MYEAKSLRSNFAVSDASGNFTITNLSVSRMVVDTMKKKISIKTISEVEDIEKAARPLFPFLLNFAIIYPPILSFL
jgi:hypothetical protein